MSERVASLLDDLRRPEYTGENRCVPCTVVNALIAVAVAVPAFVVSTTLGAVVLALSGLAIYLRGYLVPGTPQLTKRYLPERVLSLFGKSPLEKRTEAEFVDRGGETVTGFDEEAFVEGVKDINRRHDRSVDPGTFLEEAGVLESAEDQKLSPAFLEAVRERIRSRRDGEIERDVLAELFDADPEDIEELDREYPAYKVGVRVRKWPSRGAAIADVAGQETLAEWTEAWNEDVSVEQRADVLEWFRGLYDACPVCDGEVRFSDDVIESCCGQFNVTTVACEDCGERLREFDPSKVGNREDLKGIAP